MESNRRLWIIDGAYIQYTQGDKQIDYLKLRNNLEASGKIWRAYYLNSKPISTESQVLKFYNWLQLAPPAGPQIITKIYDLKQTNADRCYCEDCNEIVNVVCTNQRNKQHSISNYVQKGVDVGMVVLALTLIDRYDTLILSSGDGDLLDMVEHLTRHGKRLELAVFKASVSVDLQSRADEIYWIDDFIEEVIRE